MHNSPNLRENLLAPAGGGAAVEPIPPPSPGVDPGGCMVDEGVAEGGAEPEISRSEGGGGGGPLSASSASSSPLLTHVFLTGSHSICGVGVRFKSD